jgi:ribulose-phosphate 3-epimerase
VSFHHEAVGDPEPAIAKARAAGLGVGVTLNLETPIQAALDVLEQVDDVMLMSIRPGWSGQQLNPDVYPRLEAIRTEIDRRGLDIGLEIDGGVRIDNAQTAVDAGANVLIAASGIFQAADPAASAAELARVARGEAA